MHFFTEQDCCYTTYTTLLNLLSASNRYMDYSQAAKCDSFIVLRHDIEFSITRAYGLAKLEHSAGITSSYMVQLTNNAYNALSRRNMEMLQEMAAMGHHIGLHYHANGETNLSTMSKQIQQQAFLLSAYLDQDVDRFSFHRPTAEMLSANMVVDGLMNLYGSSFFTFTSKPCALDADSVKYFADSNHQWKYGRPDKEALNHFKRIQLLVHPLSWTKAGENHSACFRDLKREKAEEFVQCVSEEWKFFDCINFEEET